MAEWKIAPRVPSEEMRHAFQAQMDEWMQEIGTDDDLYTAMLAAAPRASEDEALVAEVAKVLNAVQRENGDKWCWHAQARAVLKMLEG